MGAILYMPQNLTLLPPSTLTNKRGASLFSQLILKSWPFIPSVMDACRMFSEYMEHPI